MMNRIDSYSYLIDTFKIVRNLDLNLISQKILEFDFREKLKNDKPILIYGAGNIGKITYRKLNKIGYNVEGFLDRNAEENQKIFSVPVYKAEIFCEKSELSKYRVFIAILITDKEKNQIIDNLKKLGCSHIEFIYEYLLGFNECIVRDLPLMDINKVKKDILKVFNMFEDDHSREIFVRSLRARATLNFQDVMESEETIQYFKPKVTLSKGFNKFVDCGAFTGDTLNELSKYYNCDTYIGFEPDKESFNKLLNTSENLSRIIKNIRLYPYATSDTNTYKSFLNLGNGMSSTLSDKGTEVVETVKLDNIIKELDITMIKMDIEGAEIETLKGAKNIICNNKPDLAICVYHRISDFWEIPLLLKDLVPNYRLYLRSHSKLITMENVLYASI